MTSLVPAHKLVEEPKQLKALCVFCGSSPGNNPVYVEVAKKLGKLLAEKNVALVYGGGNLGIMGALASSVSENGGKVIGIIPSAMVDLSGSVKNEERIVVPDMHTRKRTMLAKSDALLALPGGFGTAEELFEAITWSQLSIHKKPVGILNINKFYDGFLSWLDTAITEGFIRESNRDLLLVCNDVNTVLDKLRHHHVEDGVRYDMKWTDATKSVDELI